MEHEVTELMLRTQGGDAAAFDELVRRLRSRAFTVAHGLVGSREDALDLAQEAFLRTYQARASFQEGQPFLPWFHRILRNTCFSFLRRHRRLRKVSLSGAGEDAERDFQITDEGPEPSAGIESDELAQAFWRAFRSLGARDREILGLRHFQELSYKEIAQAMGTPVGTVMSRLFHARARLRRALGPRLEDELSAPLTPPIGTRR